jgi:hypothetical protein
MNSIDNVLDKAREDNPGIFHQRALQEQPVKTLPVYSVKIPTDAEIWRDRDYDDRHREIEVKQFHITPNLNNEPFVWDDYESERESFEDSDEANRQRAPFGNRPRQTGMELLAIYKPFHLYPEGEWGVLFFEKPMLQFCNRLMPHFHNLGFTPTTAKKMITYALARHEFMHYLHELKTFDLEMTKGGQVYIPYFNNVYKRTYPGPDCIEETVATVGQWDNNVMRTPVDLQLYWKHVIGTIPALAYSNAANFDHETIHPTEDKLVSQANQCNPNPAVVQPVWGSLPRPFVQPWTRYENVQWMMTQSAGGILASQLGGNALRNTMPIYHV